MFSFYSFVGAFVILISSLSCPAERRWTVDFPDFLIRHLWHLHPSDNPAEDHRAGLITEEGRARVCLQPVISISRLATRKYRQPVEIRPTHFPGCRHRPACVQVKRNQRWLAQVLCLDDLPLIQKVFIGIFRSIFFDHARARHS